MLLNENTFTDGAASIPSVVQPIGTDDVDLSPPINAAERQLITDQFEMLMDLLHALGTAPVLRMR